MTPKWAMLGGFFRTRCSKTMGSPAFEKHQRRLSENGEDYWIDRAFHNYRLRRFVPFEPKARRLET